MLPFWFAQSVLVTVPLDSWVYSAIEKLAGLGFIKTGFLGLKPWTRMECTHLVEESRDAIESFDDRNLVHSYGMKSSRDQLHVLFEDGGGVNGLASDRAVVLFRARLNGVIPQNHNARSRQLVR